MFNILLASILTKQKKALVNRQMQVIGLVNRKSDESNSDMNIDGIFSLNPNGSGGERWFINFPINMKLGFRF